MNLFWEEYIKPIATSIDAKHFLEIGAEDGFNTRNILAFCNQNQKKLTVIDPKPAFDQTALQQVFKEATFHVYHDTSLTILPEIDQFDIALIDGDHNWYTVYHELKYIEQKYIHITDHFPIIFLHDICWPYARRDMYYNPLTIPDEFLHKHKKAGINYCQSELCSNQLYNANLNNALHEGGNKNGVLTAVEDFLAESNIKFDWLTFPIFHGLGILVSHEKRQASKSLDQVLNELRLSERSYRDLQKIESIRLKEVINYQNRIISMEKQQFSIKTRFSQMLSKLFGN